MPEREEIQTAIAQLWGSISAFKDGEEHVGIMYTTAAVELVLPDISDRRLLDRYLEAAVRICEEHESNGVLEVTIDCKTYDEYFKPLEKAYQGKSQIELLIPQSLFPVLNQFPIILKPK